MKKEIEIEWFGHSCFKIKVNKSTIFFDPIRTNNLLGTTLEPKNEKEISAIFISHEHWDHFDVETILALCSPQTKIFCEQSVADPLSCKMTFDANNLEEFHKNSERIIDIKKNEIVELHEMKVKCLEATEGISFLLEVKDEKMLFMGDSIGTTEMIAEKPSIVIFPVWAVKSEEANLEDFLNLVKEGICIPMHYHTNRNALPNFYVDSEKIHKLLPEYINMRILERNKIYNLKSF